MSLLLIIGLALFGVPLSLILGFAAYIFFGFVNDDKDAQTLFRLALIVMALGAALIIAHVVGVVIQVSP